MHFSNLDCDLSEIKCFIKVQMLCTSLRGISDSSTCNTYRRLSYSCQSICFCTSLLFKYEIIDSFPSPLSYTLLSITAEPFFSRNILRSIVFFRLGCIQGSFHIPFYCKRISSLKGIEVVDGAYGFAGISPDQFYDTQTSYNGKV